MEVLGINLLWGLFSGCLGLSVQNKTLKAELAGDRMRGWHRASIFAPEIDLPSNGAEP